MSDELPPPPAFLLPRTLEKKIVNCHYCPVKIRWGTTQRGKRAPFDAEEPHVNHFSTCKARERVKRDYPRRRT